MGLLARCRQARSQPSWIPGNPADRRTDGNDASPYGRRVRVARGRSASPAVNFDALPLPVGPALRSAVRPSTRKSDVSDLRLLRTCNARSANPLFRTCRKQDLCQNRRRPGPACLMIGKKTSSKNFAKKSSKRRFAYLGRSTQTRAAEVIALWPTALNARYPAIGSPSGMGAARFVCAKVDAEGPRRLRAELVARAVLAWS